MSSTPTVCKTCKNVLIVVNGCVCCLHCDLVDRWPAMKGKLT